MALPAPLPSIDTCTACGKLFPRGAMRLCGGCAQSQEHRFELVRTFLEENEGAAVATIAQSTGVSMSDVRSFLEGGRLVEVEGGATPPCTCHVLGERCPTCRNDLAGKLRALEDRMAADIERTSGSTDPSRATYVRRMRRLGDR